MKKMFLLAAAAAVLSGCSALSPGEQVKQVQSMQDGSYYLVLSRPWVSRVPDIRDQALDIATEACAQQNMGMQPGEIVTRQPGAEYPGATAHLTYRCVAFLPTPKDRKAAYRLGFYKDEASREAINRELDEEMN